MGWLQQIAKARPRLTVTEIDNIVLRARRYGVKVRLDPPHPRTAWNVPHLNIGKRGQVHLAVPQGYQLP